MRLRKFILFLFLTIALMLTGCSNNIPNYLLFEGNSDHWRGEVEIKQSKRSIGKYYFTQRKYAEYLGDDVEQLEKSNDIEITWSITGITESVDKVYLSHFQREIGHLGEMASSWDTNNKTFYIKEDAEVQMVIQWGKNEEVIELQLKEIEK